MDSSIFNTDDVMGIYPGQICEEDAWKIGNAASRFLPSLLSGYERGQANTQSLCVGRDMRTYSEVIAKALIDGMVGTGASVVDVGMIDTPQMYFAINHLGTCGGVQVTGSNNPAKFTGFKIFGLGAKPVSADTGLHDIEHIAMALLHTKSKANGKVRQCDMTEEYKNHVLKFFDPSTGKLKIAVDASNGMAGKIIPIIFKGLPFEITELNFELTGKFKHSPDPLIEKNLSQVKAAVTKNNCDFGVCFDAEAGKVVIIDEKGQAVGCDLIMALMVPYFLEKNPKSTVVYDLRSSRVVVEEIIKCGGTPRRERIGPVYMKKAMRDSHALFGGDMDGRFYYRDNYLSESGVITLVHVVNILNRAGMPVSELINPLQRYYKSDELNFEVDDTQTRIEEFARRYSDGQIDYFDGITIGYKEWWFNCRASDNGLLRLNIEARSKELLDEKLTEITEQLDESA